MTKVLLKDVARRAGVSEMTASRALRGAPDVSAATRAKVAEAASALGYVPNRIAGALASRSVNLIGVVAPSLSSYVFPEVLRGVSAGLGDSPLKPVVGVTGYDLDEEQDVITEMLSWRPSGLIVAGLEHTDAARRMLKAAGCPVVEIMDVDGEPVQHCVGVSHLAAGRAMAEAMLARGYRRIGFIGTKMQRDFRAQKRLTGFEEGLAAGGAALADRELYAGGSSIATGRDMTARLLARSPDLDCLYFSSDVMAIGALMHAIAAGLSIPEDFAIAGFNRLELLEGLPVDLATTDAHRFEIGRRAAEIILGAAGPGAGDAPVIEELQPTITYGQSL